MTIDVVNKEIGVCQSCEDLSVWLLLHNINVMPRLKLIHITTPKYRAVVVAQLVERSLPIPEVRGSNPVISKNLFVY